MLTMILKMTGVTVLSVLITTLLWKKLRGQTLKPSWKLAIGLIYGIFAVLSTHFGVDFNHMMVNVRDLGPLSAGLFFDPISGIIAGLIGGIERFIAGEYWGVGSYTRIACSVSTCLAGFVAAGLHLFIFDRKKPSSIYAFFMGAVMEVFHMYVVFITHREDMSMAFYVVRNCAPPMIIFTGLGMAASSTSLRICAGEWRNPFRKLSAEDIPVSRRFQLWLFAVTSVILLLNLLFAFTMQTQTALQDARGRLETISTDIRQNYDQLKQTESNTNRLINETARKEAMAIAETLEKLGGVETADDIFLERMRSIYNLAAITAVNENGEVIAVAGQSPVYSQLLTVLDGGEECSSINPSSSRTAAGARCGRGMVQAVIDKYVLINALNMAGLRDALSYFHVGNGGTFDVLRSSGIITVGDHKGMSLTTAELARVRERPDAFCFTDKLFGVNSICRIDRLEDGMALLVQLPIAEVYNNRDIQTYETALGDIILFAVIYVLISMLVQDIVVNNLELVNDSLHRITQGDLDEVVSVRNSSEFASLSNDINQTVSVLKGYIAAAEKRIEQELEFARVIQDSALPKNFTFPRNDFEIYATMDPAKEVGGDFYDFFFVGQNRLALVIADVSGKGIPASLFMMRAKTTIRGLAESGREPAEILYRVNNTLCEGNEAEMFVTVWLGIIDLSTGLMKCANAGHEYPTLMRAGGDFELFKDRHGLALAAMGGVKFRDYELQLNPGDKLFVYTDGIPEAIDEQVEQYGTDRLLRILNDVKDESMQAILPTIREDISDFAGEAEQFDDITMLGFAYFGSKKGGDEQHEAADV